MKTISKNNNHESTHNSREETTKLLESKILRDIQNKYEYCIKRNMSIELLKCIFEFTMGFDWKRRNNEQFYLLLTKHLSEKIDRKAVGYVITMAKVFTFYLHAERVIELSYLNIEFLSSRSTVLKDFITRIMDIDINKSDFGNAFRL